MRFTRVSNNPFISKTPGSFFSRLVANPDVVEFDEILYFFFRGQDEFGHDQIGVWTKPASEADGINWDKEITDPVIRVSENQDEYDSNHVLDPAAVVFNNQIYLYYTAKSNKEVNNHSIGLAISPDGKSFRKIAQNPILYEAIAPEVLIRDSIFYMFFQRHNLREDCWEIFLRTSEDGIEFSKETEKVVICWSKIKEELSLKSIATIRIFQNNGFYYMTYGACEKFLDYPENFKIARSSDLYNWEFSKGESILSRGEIGQWDEGAIWYPTIHKVRDKFFMWYEGAGTGNGALDESAQRACQVARNENYGGYLVTSFSQVGVATLDESEFTWT